VLAPIYQCFTEGFDLPGLNAAKALLAQLESAPRRARSLLAARGED
jgi:hypothetical protein